MKCLVTGGAGFVGSNLVDELIKQGHDVVIVDNLSTGNKNNIILLLATPFSTCYGIFRKQKNILRE